MFNFLKKHLSKMHGELGGSSYSDLDTDIEDASPLTPVHSITYGDMSMSTFGLDKKQALATAKKHSLSVPKKHTKKGGKKHPSMHGDDDPNPAEAPNAAQAGDTSSMEPNYGAGDTGVDFQENLVASGGEDPFANATDTDQPGESFRDEDYAARNAPTGYDVYDPPERIPTLRNPHVDFGLNDEFYSGFGPSALIAGDSYSKSRIKQ